MSITAESSTGQCWEQTHQRVIIRQDKGSTGASHSAGGETGSLPRGVGVEGDSQGFAGERALGHLGGDQRAGAPQLPVCAARREQV